MDELLTIREVMHRLTGHDSKNFYSTYHRWVKKGLLGDLDAFSPVDGSKKLFVTKENFENYIKNRIEKRKRESCPKIDLLA